MKARATPRAARAPWSHRALALVLLLVAGCAAPREARDWAIVREVTPAFLANASTSDAMLAADAHGRVALTWVTRDAAGKDLWLAISRDSGVTFGPPVRVNRRGGHVESYPEGRPIVVFGPAGELAIAWAERRSGAGAATDIVVRASGDAGVTLGPIATVNDDRDAAGAPSPRSGIESRRGRVAPSGYHAFPALTFLPDGALFAAWLDGRHHPSGDEEPPYATLYTALSGNGGQTWSPNVALADSICACCRPSATNDAAGRIAVSYRSAFSNFRDPAIAVSSDRGTTFPLDTVVSADRWRLEGCPAQGPAITWNRASGGVLAWFTGAGAPGVYLLPWHSDHGAAGVKRPLGDSLQAARSPRLASWERSTFVAVEARPRDDSTRTVLAVRALDEDGSLTPWTFLGAGVRASWIAATGARNVLACWTEEDGDRTRVRVARITRRAGG